VALDEAARPKRAPGTAWQTIDGETVLLDIDHKQLLGLNEVGARVWLLCDGARTAGEIVRTIAEEFSVDADTARADVAGFLDELYAAELLV
jgi:hypothetical protein